MIKKYKLISSEVEAVQWTGDNFDELKALCGRDVTMYNCCVFVNTPNNGELCNRGDYILKNSNGYIKIMNDKLFEQAYEEVVDGNER